MRKRCGVLGAVGPNTLVMACLLTAAMGCGPRIKPGLQASINVEGNDKPGERARRIVITFDRAMVEGPELGQVTKKSPVNLKPQVPGVYRWRENRVLVFEPDLPLPRATPFRVTVAKGTRALDGLGLADAVEHTFETERLSLQASLVTAPSLPDARRWAVPEQEVRLTFNLPVSPKAVAQHCSFKSEGKQTRVSGLNEQGYDATDWVLKPSEPLALDTRWSFECASKLRSKEGPLGLLPVTDATDPSTLERDGRGPRGLLSFHTFGPMAVELVKPNGAQADPDAPYVTVFFTNPLAPSGGQIDITPAPRDQGDAYPSGAWLYLPIGGLEPHVTYTVKVGSDIKDVFGQTLDTPFETTFTAGDVTPGFALETGSWTVESAVGVYRGWARNVSEVHVLAAAVSPAKLFELLPKISWWDDQPVDLAALKIKSVERLLKVEGPENRWNQVTFNPAELLGPAAKGSRFYYIAAAAPELKDDKHPAPYRQILMNVTGLGLTTKFSGGTGQVWVTRLADGRPQSGAEVSVRDRKGRVRWKGVTDASGLVQTPGIAALGEGKLPVSHVDSGWEHEEGDFDSEADLLVFAQVGDDITFVDPQRAGAFSGWYFNVSTDNSQHAESLRGFMHTDRGLYRPGDVVQLRGLVRKLALGRGLVPVAGKTIQVSISDPRGRVVKTAKLTLSRYGSWHTTFSTEADAPLGDYRVVADLPDGSFYESFQVEAYRANTFEVKVKPAKQEAFGGSKLELSAEGLYFYGAPVRGGDVSFSIHGRHRYVSFKAYPDFDFADDLRYERGGRPYGQESFWSEEETRLDQEGRGSVQLDLPKYYFREPMTLMVSATVQDETSQSVSAFATVPVHPARFYLGIDTGDWFAQAGEAKALRLVALSTKGAPIAAQATLTVTRHSWKCAFEAWGYRGSYRCQETKEPVLKQKVALSKEGPQTVSFTPAKPGQYSVALEGWDGSKNEVRAATRLWVSGRGESDWEVDESGRFELLADKTSYAPGDVARLLPKTSLGAGATALLAIEREGVLETRLLPEVRDGQAIEVPIGANFAPNVYVSLLVSRGRTEQGSRGLPNMTMGLVNLPVDYEAQRLSVSVHTDKAEYRPGEAVTATLKVRDAQGRGVRSEVALAAADEGVLSLINYQTPDPLSRFYAPWGLGVMTASQLARLAQVPEPGEDRYVTGGDSAGAPGTFRARFRATAYWNPGVETDDKGHAEVTFPAPDNLTAFRVMAVAADEGARFGHADKRFAVNKPLQLLSALPRFASVGDAFEAAVLVQNETGEAGSVTVTLEAKGLRLEGAKTQTLKLAKGGRARAAFPVKVERAGQATLRFAATLGEAQDGLEQRFPLHYPAPLETQALSDGVAAQATEVAITLPTGVLPGSATLEVTVDPDGLAGLEDTLRELVQYPYGCLEQTVSRLIPLVAVRTLAESLKLPEIKGPKLESFIQAAVHRIGRFQNSDGGFGLWVNEASEAYYTAFALFGLKLAADAGYKVDVSRVEEGLTYLKRSLDRAPQTSSERQHAQGELGNRAFTLFVLTLHNAAPSSHLAALYDKRRDLPHYGLAFLARALAGALGPKDAQVRTVLSELEALVPKGTRTPWIQERGALPWYMSSDGRTTAVVAAALLALEPRSPLGEALTLSLFKALKEPGYRSTQEQVYSLLAVSTYASQQQLGQAAVEVRRGSQVLLKTALNAKAGRLHTVSVPLTGASTEPLVIAPSQGRVFYSARVRYRRSLEAQTAVQAGFKLERDYFDPRTGAPLSEVRSGELVRVSLRVTNDAPRHYVALTDLLPAGLEALNTRFVTTETQPDRSSSRNRLWSTYREIQDERVSSFSNWMGRPQTYTLEYLARATTSGTFVAPAATVEAMYEPALRGSVEPSSLRVLPASSSR